MVLSFSVFLVVMVFKPFILLLAAHFLGDVFFNSYRLAVLKRSSTFLNQVVGVGSHCLIHAFFAGTLLFMGNRLWIRGALLVFGFHFFNNRIQCN